MKKFLFLDVDGVLNYEDFLRKSEKLYALCPQRILLAQNILAQTGADPILSSSWRIGEGRKVVGRHFNFAGLTPDILNGTRGDEICEYLRLVGYTLRVPEAYRVVILDDDMDAYVAGKNIRFLRTRFDIGLTREIADMAIKFLNS